MSTERDSRVIVPRGRPDALRRRVRLIIDGCASEFSTKFRTSSSCVRWPT